MATAVVTLERVASKTTVDGTANVSLEIIAIPDQVHFIAEVNAAGATAGAATNAALHGVYCGYRNGGGGVVLTTAPFTADYTETTAGLDISTKASGNDFVVQVTGLAGTTIYWMSHTKLTYYGTP